ncbi:NAD(P)-dependent dehydrogenase, short-chain alcohol dehydrogenase family [Chitinophaga costaii]|uniref:NAD(P)-dependent dehydrogenase, short-chain alcohol dehydrogenase family n=1 Tax=Chitinophaga costaii TaxID=1335309 RepID=A0A1C4EL24_9BACT|nr:SDR family oxidoreductase [Chitinophaga costaii]PUZ22418.1 KR domain-containing protein [Chitinophaga costaii]SCC44274.1 NAD(P)-dependent dehydrogenase, short-chain alcohol dehydrogenase family [Chitinophaga costaii]
MDFTNKNVVVTGGSTGIGFATAKAFISAGANVWITGRSAGNLQKAAATINSPQLKTVVSDTSNLAGIEILEKAIAESGIKLDVLFLNAGIAVFAPIEFALEADFDAQFNTNVKGYFFTLQKMIPHLKDGASVVFTSSNAAHLSNINVSAYSATKSAVNTIARVAANELAVRKIRVNIVTPGPTDTGVLSKVGMPKEVEKQVTAQIIATTAVKRMGEPEEIANIVLFLSSDKAGFITGSEFLVDGGMTNYALK